MPRRMINDVLAGRKLVTATKEMTVRAASRLMAEQRIGALVVVEGGRIAGIFTERDALNKVIAAALDPDSTALSSVMVSDPQTIGVDKPLAYALYMMAEGGFRHVPVVDAGGVPIGMVSARDALGQDLVDFERELKHLEELEGSIGY
ncbi:MAG: CBS domain-containing protein [Dechloromonas sp.]|nr:MAG: CBS domain-containing protein [Dechloromonas sp.]